MYTFFKPFSFCFLNLALRFLHELEGRGQNVDFIISDTQLFAALMAGTKYFSDVVWQLKFGLFSEYLFSEYLFSEYLQDEEKNILKRY